MTSLSKKEFLDTYGDIKVTFSSYTKHFFTYKSESDKKPYIVVIVSMPVDELYSYTVDLFPVKISKLPITEGFVFKDTLKLTQYYLKYAID